MIHTYVSVIISLCIIEVLLSVDNALVNAALAEALPQEERKRAIRIGIALGAIFRILALFIIAFIIQNVWLKVLGALYLIYLAVAHLGRVVDEEGHAVPPAKTFKAVVFQIVIADIVFSMDNLISAVSFSSNTVLVVFGVLVGVTGMLFITPILSGLIHRYKGMPQAAYTIVGLIGVSLLVETMSHIHIDEVLKFITIIAIVGFTVIYEHSELIRMITTPVLKKLQYIAALPLDVIYGAGNIVKRVFEKVNR
jgi:YkoY family integral membrane protein